MFSSKPSHRILAVESRGEGKKKFYQDIGAAWAHKDGKGFNLKLSYLPLNRAEIILRAADDKAAAVTTTDGGDA